MRIEDSFIYLGKKINLVYEDVDSFDELPYTKCRQVYGICFCDGKLVIGFGGRKNSWGLIGGTIEPGETYEQTLSREIQEESNMKVEKYWPLGYQYVVEEDIYQLRFACIVSKIGEFKADPAGGVTKIKLINPADYKKYFDWGQTGDHIINRALELAK